VQDVVIGPGCLLSLGDATQQPVLVKAKKDLLTGDMVTVKLTFEKAGEITLTLPIAPPTSPLPRVTVPLEGEEDHE
jgi:copper(I)-binding protein